MFVLADVLRRTKESQILVLFNPLFCLQVVFEAVTGDTYRSDIAVDSLSITSGLC